MVTNVSDDLMDSDMKKLLYGQRKDAMKVRNNKASNIGSAAGVIVGLPVGAITGSTSPVYITSAGGGLIGLGLAAASNKSALPDDKSAYGTSSVIIFDREGSLDIIKTKQYKGK